MSTYSKDAEEDLNYPQLSKKRSRKAYTKKNKRM